MKITEEDFQAMQGNAHGTQRRTADTSKFTREELLSYQVNTALECWSMEGRFEGLAFHVANEVKVPNMKPHQAKRFWDKRYAIGIKKGAPDWVIAWPGGSGFIELKAPETRKAGKRGESIIDKPMGKLSPEQIAFRNHCEAMGTHYTVAYTVEQVERDLMRWEALAWKRR